MATIPNLPFSGQALKTALDAINQEVGNIPAGDDGADGRTILNGTGAPASGIGADGDFYIDTAATAIYGPKNSGAWGSATSLVGPAGQDGADGSDAVLPGNLVTSDTTEAGGGTAVGNIVQITQTAYDALDTPDADTLYVING